MQCGLMRPTGRPLPHMLMLERDSAVELTPALFCALRKCQVCVTNQEALLRTRRCESNVCGIARHSWCMVDHGLCYEDAPYFNEQTSFNLGVVRYRGATCWSFDNNLGLCPGCISRLRVRCVRPIIVPLKPSPPDCWQLIRMHWTQFLHAHCQRSIFLPFEP